MSDFEQEQNLIFISYTKADRERVSPYYTALKSSSYQVWMDIHDIKGGQNWDFEITKAMDRATIIVAFVSKNSIDRRGYIQKELRLSLEKYREKLVDDIFLIPVMLDGIDIPALLKPLQVLYEKDDCIESIKSSISVQLTRLGEAVTKVQESHDLSWSYLRYRDAWEGLPGYDASYQLVRIYSSEHARVEEISHLIRGYLSHDLMAERQVMFQQDSGAINFGKSKFWRTNTYDATCTGISVVENVISIEYTIYTFLAGAAHGCTQFKTFVFIIHPTVYLEKIEQIFVDPDKALAVLQQDTRSQLLRLEFNSEGEETVKFAEHWVHGGTSKWEDFSAFAFTEDGLVLTFAPYQVAAFAFGPQRATVKWRAVRPFIKQHILCALGREFEHFNEQDEAEQREFLGRLQ